MKLKYALIIAILFSFTSQMVNAQNVVAISVGGGTMFYSGDLQDDLFPNKETFRWNSNVELLWQIDHRWGLQFGYTLGEISGDQSFSKLESKQRKDLRFHSLIHELAIRGTYDLLRNDQWKVLPYLAVGVGVIHWNPKRDDTELQPLRTEGVNYSLWSISFPTGLGGKYQMNCNWAIKAELNYHWTLTDYLDDVSGAYPENEVPIFSDPGNVAPPNTLRGNSRFNDGFWNINVGVTYYFKHCKDNGI